MACPHCGAPDQGTFTRDGLVAHRDPFRINFRGRKLDLSPAQAEILYKLVRFGRASFDVLQGARSYESVRVLVHSIRKALPSELEIEAVRGWGYLLHAKPSSRILATRPAEALALLD